MHSVREEGAGKDRIKIVAGVNGRAWSVQLPVIRAL